MIWKRPSRPVAAVLVMPPWYEVAVMRAPSIGSVSGPVTRPRMMSVCCWAAAEAAERPKPAITTTRRVRKRVFTGRDTAPNEKSFHHDALERRHGILDRTQRSPTGNENPKRKTPQRRY